MGTILASAIMATAAGILHDEGFERWTEAVLFEGLNYAQREIVFVKPDTNPVAGAVKLAAGGEQAIPAGGVALLRISHNMGTDGTTPGKHISKVAREKLEAYNPYFAAAEASAAVKHYTSDDQTPTMFTVVPPQPSASQGYVWMVYADTPDDMVKPAGDYAVAINLPDVYANVMLYFALYWAYQRDADFSPASAARARDYYQLFLALLGKKDQAEAVGEPLPAARHDVG